MFNNKKQDTNKEDISKNYNNEVIDDLKQLVYYREMANNLDQNTQRDLWYYLQTKIILPLAQRLTRKK